MAVRGIRGATNVAENTREEIFAKTRELLEAMIRANRVKADDVAAAFFTMTPDLDADFPAYVARDMGWKHVPMMCASELGVPGGMKKVVRIMLLVNTNVPPEKIRHQYLGDTPCLRPDLAKTDGQTSRKSRDGKRQGGTRR